jgi:hypothetical protein
MPDFIPCCLALSDALPKRLKRYVQPDLVPVSETVCHGLRGRKYVDRDPFNVVFLNTIRQRPAGKTHDVERRVVQLRKAGFLSDGQPHFKRRLSCETVKAQSREQTHYPSGNAFGRLGKAMVLGWLCAARDIKSSPDPDDGSLFNGHTQIYACDAVRVEVTRPEYSCAAREVHQPRNALICHRFLGKVITKRRDLFTAADEL